MNEKNEQRGERATPGKIFPVGSGDEMETNTKWTMFCSRCGAEVREINKFCKTCGFELESPEKGKLRDEKPAPVKSQKYVGEPASRAKPASEELEWGTVIKGGILAVVLSAVLGFMIGLFFFDASIITILALAAFSNILALFIGGLYAGRKALNRGATHGSLAGVACVLISQPINLIAGIPISIGTIIGAMFWGAIIGVLGGFVGSKLSKASNIHHHVTPQTHYD